MRAKNRNRREKALYIAPPAKPKPTLRELAVKACAVFNPGGDKTQYIEYMSKFDPELKALIIKEMQLVWAGK